MLTKNIYILYPAGYGGAYIHWCINKSEKDLANLTVDDPINKEDSLKFGGAGTAHLHVRIPTHQSIHAHFIWMAHNQPKEKKVFIINCQKWEGSPVGLSPEWAISHILQADPDPVFIYIHDDGIEDNKKFGALNTIMKWPIFFKANQTIEKRFNFDSFNCKDSIEARNLFAEKYQGMFPKSNGIDLKILAEEMEWYQNWYTVRNTYNGHEVNEETYVLPTTGLPVIHSLSIADAMSLNFLPWFDNFLNQINAGEFNTDYVRSYHQNYVDAQNLKWFDEIAEFRKTFQLTDYLCSHSLLQAFVIMEVKKYLPPEYNWRNQTIDNIVNEAIRHRVA